MDATELRHRKTSIRHQALAMRRALPDKDQLSRQIMATATDLPEYRTASSVLFFVDRRDEVQTQPTLTAALAGDKRLVIPYCVGEDLILFQLESWDELEPATFGVLEPRPKFRALAEKHVTAADLDLVFVPGLAFDLNGSRVGYGRGYFDRLLSGVRADTALVGLAFDCQIFPELPAHELDVPVHKIITDQHVYDCR